MQGRTDSVGALMRAADGRIAAVGRRAVGAA